MYRFDHMRSKWRREADDEVGARLAVCDGRPVWVGGEKGGAKVMDLNGGFLLPDMLVECSFSTVLSVSGGSMVVMGGVGNGMRPLNDVQVFDGKTQTWHKGPSLPQPCYNMSAVVHGDLVFVMGGYCMDRALWCTNIINLVSHILSLA